MSYVILLKYKLMKVDEIMKKIIIIFRSGYYIYLETSWPARHGYTSTLSSGWYEPSESRCLTFWYNMYGHSVGSLRVYITDDMDVKKLLWLRSGQQGQEWRKSAIEISSTSKYKVKIHKPPGRCHNLLPT